jgi:hypothetical protein
MRMAAAVWKSTPGDTPLFGYRIIFQKVKVTHSLAGVIHTNPGGCGKRRWLAREAGKDWVCKTARGEDPGAVVLSLAKTTG